MRDLAAKKAYMSTRVKTSGPGNLVLMLHQGALKFLNLAEKAIREDDYRCAHEYLVRTQDIIVEIRSSFSKDVDPELFGDLVSLYGYMHRRLIEANVKKDSEPIGEVRGMLEQMHEAWGEVSRQMTAGGIV